VADALWRLVAWLVTRPAVSRRIQQRAARTPYGDIYGADGKSLYMRRWWLFNPYEHHDGLRMFPWFPWSVRVHHIVRPDEDRHLHDHPWNCRTIILNGWYVEERAGGKLFERNAGDTASITHNEFHRIRWVDPNVGAVTLFITGRYRGTWGFKVPYREYLAREQRQ
jgi:hypothetical protein